MFNRRSFEWFSVAAEVAIKNFPSRYSTIWDVVVFRFFLVETAKNKRFGLGVRGVGSKSGLVTQDT